LSIKVDQGLAFRAIQLALIAPSFDIASQILKEEGVDLGANKIRRLVSEIGSTSLPDRVDRLLWDESLCPFENSTGSACNGWRSPETTKK